MNKIAGMIGHPILKPTMTTEKLDAGCHKAAEHGVASLCLMPPYLETCARILGGHKYKKQARRLVFHMEGMQLEQRLQKQRQRYKTEDRNWISWSISAKVVRLPNERPQRRLEGTYVREEIERLTMMTHDAWTKG